ncbi:MAG TPA: hypothetical protein PK948_08755 [Gemmatimonadales bacterium]|nr:hypothetical protein [Gemmatimonadales bacterium]
MGSVRRSLALAWLFAAAAFPSRTSAQATPAARESAVAGLHTGEQIRVAAAGLGRLIGRAGVADDDSLDLAQEDAVRRIAIPAIDTLWTRGHATITGAVVGGVLGGVFGGLAGAVGSGVCEYDCGDPGTAIALGAAAGAVVGAGLGAIVGLMIPKWDRAFP